MTSLILETPLLAAKYCGLGARGRATFDVVKRQPILRGDTNAFLLLAMICISKIGQKIDFLLPAQDADLIKCAQIAGLIFVGHLVNDVNGAKHDLWDETGTFQVYAPFNVLPPKSTLKRVTLSLENELNQNLKHGAMDWIAYARTRERFFAGINRPELSNVESGSSVANHFSAPSENTETTDLEWLLKHRKSDTHKRHDHVSRDLIKKLILQGFISDSQKSEGIGRPFASAGALYQTRVYTVFHGDQSNPGIVYRSDSLDMFCELPEASSDRVSHNLAMLNQRNAINWNVKIYVTGCSLKVVEKYGPRAYRNLFIEAGSILQNFHLLSHARCINSRIVTGMDDSLVERLLGIPHSEFVLGAILIG